MTVSLTGHIDVPADRLDQIRTALVEHIRMTRAEPGCLSFEVNEETSRPGRFTVAEKFTDSTAFRAHQARASASDWGRISDRLPRNYVVTGLTDD